MLQAELPPTSWGEHVAWQTDGQIKAKVTIGEAHLHVGLDGLGEAGGVLLDRQHRSVRRQLPCRETQQGAGETEVDPWRQVAQSLFVGVVAVRRKPTQ